MRTSDRVCLEIPITIAGRDATGRNFEESTRTLVLCRTGARIISKQVMVPRQKLTIRCLKTGLETSAQVVAPILGEEEGCRFGVAILPPEANVWGITFPVLSGTENPAGRVFLECAECLSLEVVHLDISELEILLVNECITRPCPQCKRATLWMRAASRGELVPVNQANSPPRHTTQERKSPRIKLRVAACLRNIMLGEETVLTENVSRGGFRFLSHKDYPIGASIEAALQYSPGAANIFTPARIVYKEPRAIEGTFAHGVAYIQEP